MLSNIKNVHTPRCVQNSEMIKTIDSLYDGLLSIKVVVRAKQTRLGARYF